MLAKLIRQTTVRHWRQSPAQALAILLTVALGVGVFIAVRSANRAAATGFEAFTQAVTGEEDWLVVHPSGKLPVGALPEIRDALNPLAVDLVPVVETTAVLAPGTANAAPTASDENATDTGDPSLYGTAKSLRILGLDLVGIQNLPRIQARENRFLFDTSAEDDQDIFQALDSEGNAFISPQLAAEAGLAESGELRIIVNDAIIALNVVGLVPRDADRPAPPDNLIVMDLPEVQELTGQPFFVDRVGIVLPEGPDINERRALVEERLANGGSIGWQLQKPESRRATGEVMTRAFRLNLTVLSLIALVVGVYLILQALDAAVVRRRGEIATLRSLGVSSRVIRLTWLLEAGLMGVVGGVLGVLLGSVGAQVTVLAVARTVNALYQETTAKSAAITGSDVALGIVLGIVASLVAGWLPASEASRTPPAQVLVRGYVDRGIKLFQWAWLGLIPIALGIGFYIFPPLDVGGGNRFPLAGYITSFLWLFGGSLLVCYLLPVVGRLMALLGNRFATFRIASGRLIHASSRHKLAAAGLFIATGMAAGMAILISSFDATMRYWINTSIKGDIFVSSAGIASASSENGIREESWLALASDPDVAFAEPTSFARISVDGVSTFLIGQVFDSPLFTPVWIEEPADGHYVRGQTSVEPGIVSESFTLRFDKGVGDLIDVPTPLGDRSVIVTGVYAEYGNERGSIVIERRTFADWFLDNSAARMSIDLKDGVDATEFRDRWTRSNPGLSIRTNEGLRSEIFRIFRQTFSVTYALQVIGILVAITGLALALVCINLESAGDLFTLRSLGLGKGRIGTATAVEGFGIAIAGSIGGILLSFALGDLLIYVINRQSFGWTLLFDVPWMQLASLVTLVCASGTAVAWFIGRWAAALPYEREE